jgi:hypothetical protein
VALGHALRATEQEAAVLAVVRGRLMSQDPFAPSPRLTWAELRTDGREVMVDSKWTLEYWAPEDHVTVKREARVTLQLGPATRAALANQLSQYLGGPVIALD